jgi:hypothetical protein
MSTYIYLSITPEALIGSMLPPVEFGAYLATGTKKRNKGQAIFFEIDPELSKESIDMNYLNCRCISKPDGSPKSSVYLSVYRVLESIPMKAFKSLYLTTDNGVVLELKKNLYDKSKEEKDTLHLYQELCPVTPQIASTLSPSEFLTKMTDGSLHIVIPKLFIVDLQLGGLAKDYLKGSLDYLPTRHVEHLKDCLEILKHEDKKQMKTVQRFFAGSVLYRTINTGFYLGSKDEVVFYPFPGMAELEAMNYEFFRAI